MCLVTRGLMGYTRGDLMGYTRGGLMGYTRDLMGGSAHVKRRSNKRVEHGGWWLCLDSWAFNQTCVPVRHRSLPTV